MPLPVPCNTRLTEVRVLSSPQVVLSWGSSVLRPAPTPSAPAWTSVWPYTRTCFRRDRHRARVREGLPRSPTDLRCMPSPLRRSGSGLLQNPRPGLLPSPHPTGLGPLGPLRAFVSTRQSSRSLRPAALLLLASPPGSPRTPEVGYRAPLAACPGGTHTRRSIGPSGQHKGGKSRSSAARPHRRSRLLF